MELKQAPFFLVHYFQEPSKPVVGSLEDCLYFFNKSPCQKKKIPAKIGPDFA
jgi:hypothetical protein